MGLDGFLSFIKKKHPEIVYTDDISMLAHSTVFFDISSYMYRYICIYGNQSTKWVNAMCHLLVNLRKNRINLIPVFDGKPPDEKKDEIDDRKEKRAKLKDKMTLLQEAVERLTNKEDLDDETASIFLSTLETVQEKNNIGKLRLLVKKTTTSTGSKRTIEDITEEDIDDMRRHVQKLKSQMVYIGDKERQVLKDLLDILGIPYAQAPEEAEAYCCAQIKQGVAKIVISCDTDCFTHGADTVVLSLESNGEITYMHTSEILNVLGMTQSQFIDFSFLIGCDYNKKNKLFKVGPVKALELIHKYGRLEDIEGYDTEKIQHYIEMRKLFLPVYPNMKEIVCTPVDIPALDSFIEEYNLNIRSDRVEQMFKERVKPKIVFTD